MDPVEPPEDAGRFEPAAGVVSRTVGSENVLVDLDGEQYFSLNETGTVVWDLLSAGRSIEDATGELVDRFDVDGDVARSDVEELVQRLLGASLLTQA